MKKIILSAFAVMAFGFANAQEVDFGVKAAVNVASLTGDVVDASSLIGFQVGGFAEIKILDKFAIQPELMYSAQGVKHSTFIGSGEGEISVDSDTKLGYINIPVLAKYYITESLSLEAGPQIGFLISAKTAGEDVKEIYNSADFSFNVGAGFNFTEKLSVGLRYNLGLSNVYDFESDEEIEFEDVSAKNGVFSASLAYKF